FSVITYFAIEKPLRFGKRFRRAKTVGLVAAMLAVGIFGYWLTLTGGAKMWQPAMKKYEALSWAQFGLKNSGDRYIGEQKNFTGDCVFNDVGASRTVAVIGDSHAEAIYPAIAKACADEGVNALRLSAVGMLPFAGIEPDIMMSYLQPPTIASALNLLVAKRDIKKVFVVTMGASYFVGNKRGDECYREMTADKYRWLLQGTVDLLTAAGKEVFIVSENPLLPFNPRDYLYRHCPAFIAKFLPPSKEMPRVTRAEMSAYFKDYLDVLAQIKNATIINSLDLFCPNDECVIFDENGYLLYRDTDHLSRAGAEYQVRKQLAKYLEFPAGE
ncbi:MAG: hypothetical protein LBP75_06770, partial [Planctomycetota bacterium]|nr:hypothetical protein [Planctomycetota bacterium]